MEGLPTNTGTACQLSVACQYLPKPSPTSHTYRQTPTQWLKCQTVSGWPFNAVTISSGFMLPHRVAVVGNDGVMLPHRAAVWGLLLHNTQ